MTGAPAAPVRGQYRRAAMDDPVSITGRALDPQRLTSIARDGAAVRIDPAASARMRAARAVVERAARSGRPVYGVTTGLGSRVTETVDDAAGSRFSLRTIRGRATAVGEPLPRDVTRAAMAVRLNGLCAGGAGAGVGVADGLAAMLNAGVHPTIPRSGSVGAADLCLMAHVGLGLIGEGECELHGHRIDAARALRRCGLEPITVGPKDGLAICSSSAVSVGAATLALVDAETCLEAAQTAAALSMEGFRANLSPLDPRVAAARAAPGQGWAAAGLRRLLHGGELTGPGAARRLQDPLSFRCASQIHGSLRCALDLLHAAVAADLDGAADNPLVLADDEQILSTGNFHVPALAMALDAVAIAVAQVASAIAERQARLKVTRLSGLPRGLVAGGADAPAPTDTGDAAASPDAASRSGMAPLSKTAQALLIEIRHRAAPLAILSMVGADGVEDDSTGAAQAALRLGEQLERLRLLVAVELLVAAQAVDVAAPGRLGAGTAAAHRCVRELVPILDEDRPLGADVQRLDSELLAAGELHRRVGAAVRDGA